MKEDMTSTSKMKSLLLALFLFATPILGFRVNLEDELRKAQDAIKSKDLDMMTAGAQSQRYDLKKFNDV